MTKILAIVLALIAVASGATAHQGEAHIGPCGETPPAVALGGPFTLSTEDGARVTDDQVFDTPALLYFGYTTCPDICPADSARNAEAVDLLMEQGIAVRPVFITIDPERDTPEALAQFTDVMHPAMLGLTGTPTETAIAASAWGARAILHDPDARGDYLVDHTTETYLVLPGRRTVATFSRGESAATVAAQAACLIRGRDQ